MRIINQSINIYEVPSILDIRSAKKHIEFIGRKCYQSQDKITEDSCDKFVKILIDRSHGAMIEHSWVVLKFRHKMDPDHQVLTQPLIFSNFIKVHQDFENLYFCGNIRAFIEALLKPKSTIEDLAEFFSLNSFHVLDEEIPKSLRAYTVVFITNRFVSHELVRHRPASFAQKSQRYCADKDHVDFILPWSYNFPIENEKELEAFQIWFDSVSESEISYHKLLRLQSPQEARTVLPNSTATEIAITADLDEWKHIFSLRCSSAADPQMQRLMIPVQDEFIKRDYL